MKSKSLQRAQQKIQEGKLSQIPQTSPFISRLFHVNAGRELLREKNVV